MAYLRTRYRRARGFGDYFPKGPLDTSALVLAPAGPMSEGLTQAALDSLPASGLPVYNPIMYANTTPPAGLNINWWLLGGAIGVLAVGAVLSGGRR